jgi:hypothetical protein
VVANQPINIVLEFSATSTSHEITSHHMTCEIMCTLVSRPAQSAQLCAKIYPRFSAFARPRLSLHPKHFENAIATQKQRTNTTTTITKEEEKKTRLG